MLTTFIEKLLVFGPLGGLVGIAAAALSLSSWAIMLPIMFQFGVNVQAGLFTCFIIDFVNGSFMVYRYRRFVDSKGGVLLGVVAGAVAVAVALSFGKKFITNNDKYLKGGVGFADWLGGIVFALRAWKTRGQDSSGDEEEEEEEEVPKRALLATAGTSRQVSGRLSSLSQRPPSSFVVSAAALEEIELDIPPVRLMMELRKPMTKTHLLRLGAVFGATVVVGAICGVTGFGAGTIFMLLYILFLSSSTLEGAGTGSLIMAVLMASMMCVYGKGIHIGTVTEILAVALPCDLMGALFASFYAVKLSESKLSAIISVLLIFIGTFMTLEHTLATKMEN